MWLSHAARRPCVAKLTYELRMADGTLYSKGVMLGKNMTAENTLIQIQALGRQAYRDLYNHGGRDNVIGACDDPIDVAINQAVEVMRG